MRSTRPKPLHLLCGRPMVLYVLDALRTSEVERAVVVVGHGAEKVTKRLQEIDSSPAVLDFVEQVVQRGTGDAVMVALNVFPDDAEDDDDVLVLPGDTPLLRPETIAALVAEHRAGAAACTMLTAVVPDPTGYGRIVRTREGNVERIVEHRDATEEQLEIQEICTSIYCFRRSVLAPALRRVTPDNAQGELYLTDAVAVLREAGYPIRAVVAEDPGETEGVNDRRQLAACEAVLRRRTNEDWQRQGVTMVDPDRTYIDISVRLAPDVTLFPGTILQGDTVVGIGAEIGPDTRLVDCQVGAHAVVSNSVARLAEIGEGATVGPFAVLEPGAVVAPGAVTGPFYTASG